MGSEMCIRDRVNSLVDDGPSLSRTGTIGKLGVLGNNERNRDTTARFFEQISEKERIHRTQPLLRSNRALLESLRDDVVRYVFSLTQPRMPTLLGLLGEAKRRRPDPPPQRARGGGDPRAALSLGHSVERRVILAYSLWGRFCMNVL